MLKQIIRFPKLTEKNTELAQKMNQYVFEVDLSANKHEIKRAVESLLKVKVERVRTAVMHGKKKRLGRSVGRRPNWKKAVVQLKEGQTLEPVKGI
ncbi:MAG: 50S ribosomal protein L23 [Deltaproteobacteria bacterium]|nr:50S ribosomal protein L23 [Deltaproteobacteria bacterium]